MSGVLDPNCPRCGYYNPFTVEFCRRCRLRINAKMPPQGSALDKVMEYAFNNTIVHNENSKKYPNFKKQTQDSIQIQNSNNNISTKQNEKEIEKLCKNCNKKNFEKEYDFCIYCGNRL